MCYSIVFISILAFATADNECPDIRPVKHFNFTAMGNGVWYDLARYHEKYIEKSSVGNRITFFRKDDVVEFTVNELLDGKLNSFNGTLKLADNAGDTAQLIFNINKDGGIVLYLDIVEIEYDKYEILYYCIYDKNTQKRSDFAWISSRQIGADEESIDKIKKFLTSSGLIDPKRLVWEKTSDHELVSKLLKNN